MQAAIAKNRTGIASAKKLAKEMVEATEEFLPSSPGSDKAIAEVRLGYADDVEPVGSVPMPSAKGMAKGAVQVLKGENPALLIDKLGERLAFERTGVRLYQALLSKWDATEKRDGLPERAEVEHILQEELAHFQMLQAAIVKLGGDPTAVTPCANLHATLTKGVPAVAVDPRTTFSECLEAALLAELADNEAWETLVELVTAAGESELAEQFESATDEELEHLEKVRAWIARGQGRLDEGDEGVL